MVQHLFYRRQHTVTVRNGRTGDVAIVLGVFDAGFIGISGSICRDALRGKHPVRVVGEFGLRGEAVFAAVSGGFGDIDRFAYPVIDKEPLQRSVGNQTLYLGLRFPERIPGAGAEYQIAVGVVHRLGGEQAAAPEIGGGRCERLHPVFLRFRKGGSSRVVFPFRVQIVDALVVTVDGVGTVGHILGYTGVGHVVASEVVQIVDAAGIYQNTFFALRPIGIGVVVPEFVLKRLAAGTSVRQGVFETTHGLFAVADELRDAGDAQPAERTVSVRCVGYRIQFVVVGEAEAVACLYAGEDIASGVGGRGAVVARYGDAIDFYRGHVVMVSVVAAVVVISPVVEETVVVGWECRHVEVTELVKVEHVVAVLFPDGGQLERSVLEKGVVEVDVIRLSGRGVGSDVL